MPTIYKFHLLSAFFEVGRNIDLADNGGGKTCMTVFEFDMFRVS